MSAILAIDPGKSGGIAWTDECGYAGERGEKAVKMPETAADLWSFFNDFTGWVSPPPLTAYLENVHAMPKNGSKANFKLGQNLGHIEMALIAAGISIVYKTPAEWMRGIGVPTGLETTERKRWIKDRMQKRYPGVKVTNATADALGILTYAMRREDG